MARGCTAGHQGVGAWEARGGTLGAPPLTPRFLGDISKFLKVPQISEPRKALVWNGGSCGPFCLSGCFPGAGKPRGASENQGWERPHQHSKSPEKPGWERGVGCADPGPWQPLWAGESPLSAPSGSWLPGCLCSSGARHSPTLTKPSSQLSPGRPDLYRG